MSAIPEERSVSEPCMRSTIVLLSMVLALICCVPARGDEIWYPSRYGASDVIGAANNLSPEIVRQAALLVRTGRVYSLAVDTGPATPRYGHRSYQVVVVPRDGSGSLGTNLDTAFDDMVCAWQGVGTQLDGLGHHGIDFVHYNGIRAEQLYGVNGLRRLSINTVPPIVSRGLLLDMAGLYGVDVVEGGTAFNRARIEAAAKRQGVEIRKGDVVLLHTGVSGPRDRDPAGLPPRSPGLSKDGALYLAELGVVAVGADTEYLEVLPTEDPKESTPVHQILLARNGVYILENVRTADLARDGVSEFLFVLGQPRLVGAVQAIVNPIAIR